MSALGRLSIFLGIIFIACLVTCPAWLDALEEAGLVERLFGFTMLSFFVLSVVGEFVTGILWVVGV